MSEQLPSLISHESLRLITAAAKVGDLSDDVLSFLSASAEYHLLDVINDASNFRARGKRSRLTVDDVNASLELRGAEGSLVFSGGLSKPKSDGNAEADTAANKVDLRKVANAALPVCPIEPGFHMHWLAVDGQQPLLPQNPLPSSGRGKGKGGKRSRGKQAGDGAGGGGSSAVRARLSEELTTYLRRCCDAVLSRDKAKQCRALASLREDPGLQQLLPHLCTFIQSKVPEYLKRQKEPDQLAALLQMLQCLLNNKHFAFLEIYLDRLLPPLMSCLLHIDFERTVEEKAGTEKRNGSSPVAGREAGIAWPLPPRWTHWKVRDYAAELLRAICDKHGHTYPTLQARANDMFYTHLARPKTMLTTMYGAITGVACLGRMPVEQTLGPRVDSLAAKISHACLASSRRRDAKGVLEANQCRMALIRAIGSSTIAGTVKLFGEGKKEKAGPATPRVALTGADAVVDGTERKDNSSSNGSNGRSARSSSISNSPTKENAAGGIGGGSSSSNGNGVAAAAAAASGTISPDPRRRAAYLRRRLDRALYSKPTAAERAAKRAAREANAARAQAAGGSASSDGRSNAVGGAGARSSAVAPEVAGNGGAAEDGGASDLDEIVFPWYVMGLKRDGAPQGWWLTDKHRIFL